MADELVVYTLTLTISRPIRRDEWDSAYPESEHLESYVDANAQRELEKEVLQALRRLDGDCDVEVMTAVIRED